MVPSYSLVIWLPKTPKSHWSPVTPSSRKLWFSEDTQFWPKYSNGPGVTKSWQISKVTIRCHKRCLKLSWVQIWQKNSNGKCPKLPIRSAHSLRYIGGLSVNLNHLKISLKILLTRTLHLRRTANKSLSRYHHSFRCCVQSETNISRLDF